MNSFVDEPIHDSISVLIRALKWAIRVRDPEDACPQAMQALKKQEVLLGRPLVYPVDGQWRSQRGLGHRQLKVGSVNKPGAGKNDLGVGVNSTAAVQQRQHPSAVDIEVFQRRGVACRGTRFSGEVKDDIATRDRLVNDG